LGGTLCKIGSPLLSFLLCSLCTPLQDIIESKKYEEALAIVNFKGKLTKYIAKQTIVDNYPDRVLGLIRSNNALREVIKKKYFG
jgi:hypothetical protein